MIISGAAIRVLGCAILEAERQETMDTVIAS